MQKTITKLMHQCFAVLAAMSIVVSPIHAVACEVCGDFRPEQDLEPLKIDYKELGKYAELFKEYEAHCLDDEFMTEFERGFENLEELDANNDQEALIIEIIIGMKYCKKIKKWMAKQIVKMFKNIVKTGRYKHPDYAPYAIVKFHNKASKYFKVGSIEDTLLKMRKYAPKHADDAFIQDFESRVLDYYYGRTLTPKHPDHDRYRLSVEFDDEFDDSYFDLDSNQAEERNKKLEEYPLEVVIAGLEIGCGTILTQIPLPGCNLLGGFLIGTGMSTIYKYLQSDYIKDWEKKDETMEIEAA